jgi:hypothetical protein
MQSGVTSSSGWSRHSDAAGADEKGGNQMEQVSAEKKHIFGAVCIAPNKIGPVAQRPCLRRREIPKITQKICDGPLTIVRIDSR